MAKTSLNNIISAIKRRIDYDITDTGLDTLLTDIVNDSLRLMSQWFSNAGMEQDIIAQTTIQVIPGQQYRDVRKAVIVGDVTTFTGIADDKLLVNIDGTDYDDIDISAATDIDDVVTAINTAVGSTVASNNSTSSTLQITSPTTGASSSVTIADGGTSAQTVVGDLFSDSDYRTDTGRDDMGDVIQVSERTNETVPTMIPFDKFRTMYPNPSQDSSQSANHISYINNRIYFGATPSDYQIYYIDYYKHITAVTAGDTLPFENHFDPLLIAQARLEYLMFFDANNATAIATSKVIRDSYKKELITTASHNRKRVNQSASRNEDLGVGVPQAPESGTFF